MPRTAITSVANHRRLSRARAWLGERDPGAEVLIVAASLDAVNELTRKIAKEKGAVFGWHRLTLSQLSAAIAAPALASRELAPISRLGTEAIVTRLLHRLYAAGGLGHYRAIAATPGFPRAVAGVVAEVRLARLPPEAIGRVMPDLALLISTYEAELTEGGFADWPSVLELATETMSDEGTNLYHAVGLPTLLLDVPVGSEAELAFVRALATRAPEIFATVSAADEATIRRIRDGLNLQIENLDEAPRDNGSVAVTDSGALFNLQRHLFKESATPSASPGTGVEVFSAPGEGHECAEIARRVFDLARRGIAFDRIAVLLRSPEGYRAHLQETFNRAEIPVHFARGAMCPHPAGRAFYALLKCAAEGLSARRFAEYLSLGQVPDAIQDGAPPEAVPGGDRWVAPDPDLISWFTTDEVGEDLGAPEADIATTRTDEAPVRDGQLRAPRRWEKFLVDAAVIGGRDRWRRRLDGLTNEFRLRVSQLQQEDEAGAATWMRMLDDLAAFSRYAIPIIDALEGLPATAHWSEWLDRLGALATRVLKQPNRILGVLADLAPIGLVGPVTLNEVLLVLEPVLLQIAVRPPSERYGKIFVGPIETARGLSFDAVFVPGLAEKMFPRKIVEEPLLLDALREQVGDRLVTNESRLERERLGLALAVGAAEREISFSYPRVDLDLARPRVPSFYALEAVRAAEGRLPDFAELTRRAEGAAMARLGWPAPPNPFDAIDDAEYDLSILGRLGASAEEVAGSARYLVTANVHLARALRARYQRWSKFWTPADGLVSRSELVRATMARHTFGSRSYSATALQNYARCPYRFFLQAIHGLTPRTDPEAIDELDPLQRGSLIHDIQFELFARLRQGGFLPVRPDCLDQAWQELDSVIAEVAARYRDDLAPAIDRVWQDGVAAVRADLREWLRRASEDASGYVPSHFELSFGLKSRPERRLADPQSMRDPVQLECGIQLRGSIDLVERHPSGLVRVTDHKTGKATGKSGQLIDGGKSLQPLLYALAAEQLFDDQTTVSSGRLYFCTSAGGFTEQLVFLNGRERAVAMQVAEAIGEAVAECFLPAAPDKRQCERCDYRIVCGPHEERRVLRKPQERLGRLLAIRATP